MPAAAASASPPDTALLLIDLQRDFCPGGALAVPGGDLVIPVANRLLLAAPPAQPLYATRDWHPADSDHFQPSGEWPRHCVANSDGARFHPKLALPPYAQIVSKGAEPSSDGYSAFEGTLSDGTALEQDLRARGVSHLMVGGLATDYCVRHSVLDALARGWAVTVVTDAIAPVDLRAGDGDRALQEMKTAGATLRPSHQLGSPN